MLRTNCKACQDDAQPGDEHDCHWPIGHDAKVELINRVGLTVAGLDAYLERLNRAMNGIHYTGINTPYDLPSVRRGCLNRLMNGAEPSVELQHLMSNLNDIEIMMRDEENHLTYEN